MSDGRFKRLRQYKKIYQISHKKLIGRHVLTAHEKEILKYLETMAVHTAFTKSMNMTLGDIVTYITLGG
jgi:hypothetical protein